MKIELKEKVYSWDGDGMRSGNNVREMRQTSWVVTDPGNESTPEILAWLAKIELRNSLTKKEALAEIQRQCEKMRSEMNAKQVWKSCIGQKIGNLSIQHGYGSVAMLGDEYGNELISLPCAQVPPGDLKALEELYDGCFCGE